MNPCSHLFILTVLALSIARIQPSERLFVSEAVDQFIEEMKPKFKNPRLAEVFENCLPNTLDTTVYSFKESDIGDEDSFIITGDIKAMWLRDSTNQVSPYLRFAKKDKKLQALIRGVLNRQVKSVLIDPYANAFNLNAEGSSCKENCKYEGPIWERKYELDSLAAVLSLSYQYYNATGDKTPFNDRWEEAVKKMIASARNNRETTNPYRSYEYHWSQSNSRPTETLMNGQGWNSKECGLVRSAFRPSDDACKFPYLIPANIQFLVNLRHCAVILDTVRGSHETADDARKLAQEIDDAVKKQAIINHPISGEIIAYEVDGYGNSYFMDDANIPSLLSLPYLGYISQDDPLYLRTRKHILSDNNLYFFKGTAGEGIGGPHEGNGYIWPMAIIMRAYTSSDKEEIKECLNVLIESATEGLMHETFFQDDVTKYTRWWFAWANSLFGDFIIKLMNEHPDLIFN